jgi:hypothetical protein
MRYHRRRSRTVIAWRYELADPDGCCWNKELRQVEGSSSGMTVQVSLAARARRAGRNSITAKEIDDSEAAADAAGRSCSIDYWP